MINHCTETSAFSSTWQQRKTCSYFAVLVHYHFCSVTWNLCRLLGVSMLMSSIIYQKPSFWWLHILDYFKIFLWPLVEVHVQGVRTRKQDSSSSISSNWFPSVHVCVCPIMLCSLYIWCLIFESTVAFQTNNFHLLKHSYLTENHNMKNVSIIAIE